jgi:hypothetical protein
VAHNIQPDVVFLFLSETKAKEERLANVFRGFKALGRVFLADLFWHGVEDEKLY